MIRNPFDLPALGKFVLAPACFLFAASPHGFAGGGQVLINEFDALTSQNPEVAEFVELHGPGGASLHGMSLVIFDGQTDEVQQTISLDNHVVGSDGFFVIGNAGVPGVDLVIGDMPIPGFLPDDVSAARSGAIALMTSQPGSFADVMEADIVDAVVYGTDDPAAAGELELLIPLLKAGQTAASEGKDLANFRQGLARISEEGGVAREASAFTTSKPTPGASNAGSAGITNNVTIRNPSIDGGGVFANSIGEDSTSAIHATILLRDVNGIAIAAPAGGVDVTLTTSDVSELVVSVPSLGETNSSSSPSITVTIPAGVSEVIAVYTPVDEGVADGDQLVYVSANAPGFNPNLRSFDIIDNDSVTADVAITEVGARSETGLEFVEIVNTSDSPYHLSGKQLFAQNAPLFTFPPNSILVPDGVAVVFAGGVTDGIGLSSPHDLHDCALVFNAMGLPLDDSNEVVRLMDGASEVTDFVFHPVGDGENPTDSSPGTDAAAPGTGKSKNKLMVDITPTCAAELSDITSNDPAVVDFTVSRLGPLVGPLTITLTSDDSDQASISGVVGSYTFTLPDGVASMSGTIDVHRKASADGTNTVEFTAANDCYTSASDSLDVRDDGIEVEFIDPLVGSSTELSVVAGSQTGVCQLEVSGAAGTQAKLYIRENGPLHGLASNSLTLIGGVTQDGPSVYDLNFTGAPLIIDVVAAPGSVGAEFEIAVIEFPAGGACANGSATLSVIPNPLVAGPLINELDADNPGDDEDLEFIELLADPSSSLMDWSLVLFDSAGSAYHSIELNGSTDVNGLLTVGDSAVRNGAASEPGWINESGLTINDGPAAVAIYFGAAPTMATRDALFDALVYGADGSEATALAGALTPGQALVEVGAANSAKALARDAGADNSVLRNWGQSSIQVPTPSIANDDPEGGFRAWATINGLPASATPQGDDDLDRVANLIEYLVGSDPLAPTEYPLAYVFDDDTFESTITLPLGSVGGCDDHVAIGVDRSFDLETWVGLSDEDADTTITKTDSEFTAEDTTAGEANANYRLTAEITTP